MTVNKLSCLRYSVPLLLIGFAASSCHADVEVVGWTYRVMSFHATGPTQSAAVKSALWWFTNDTLGKDVVADWHTELSAAFDGNEKDYVLKCTARQDGYYIDLDTVLFVRAITKVLFGEITPRLLIATREQIGNQQWALSQTVNSEVQKWFLEFGFNIVDAASIGLSNDELLQVAAGRLELVRKLSPGQRPDLVITGQGAAKRGGSPHSWGASVKLEMTEVATGRVLGAYPKILEDIEANSPELAARQALRATANDACYKLIRLAMISYAKPEHMLRIEGPRGVNEVARLQRGLQEQLPGAVVVVVSSDFTRGAQYVLFKVKTNLPTDAVARGARKVDDPSVRVLAESCRYIWAELDD